MSENEQVQKEVVERMLSKGSKYSIEEIAEICDIEIWRVHEIKDHYQKNKTQIDYDIMVKETNKKAHENIRRELVFILMKQREQGIYEDSDSYIMNLLNMSPRELSYYKLEYMINKNKKKTAEEKMKEIVEKNKRNHFLKDFLKDFSKEEKDD